MNAHRSPSEHLSSKLRTVEDMQRAKSEWEVQRHSCKARQLPQLFKSLPRCTSCVGRAGRDACRFLSPSVSVLHRATYNPDFFNGFPDFRRVSKSESSPPIISFYTDTDPDPLFSGVFNAIVEWNELRLISVSRTSNAGMLSTDCDVVCSNA